jgi:hypothetical protein
MKSCNVIENKSVFTKDFCYFSQRLRSNDHRILASLKRPPKRCINYYNDPERTELPLLLFEIRFDWFSSLWIFLNHIEAPTREISLCRLSLHVIAAGRRPMPTAVLAAALPAAGPAVIRLDWVE